MRAFRTSTTTRPSRAACPSLFMRGNQADMNWGSGLGVNQCNCPLAQNEKQWQAVGNLTKLMGNHSFKFGLDIRRAYNLRVPSDSHRSGQLTFNHERTSSPTLGGGLGLATFMLGDVTELQPVRQHEHGRARAPVAPLLLCAGHLARESQADAQLRPEARRHQPADRERAGQRHVGRPDRPAAASSAASATSISEAIRRMRSTGRRASAPPTS